MPTRIDPYSRASVPIQPFFNETPLARATAFVWKRKEKNYLITNWHVVTGRDNETAEHVSKTTLAEPNRLEAKFHARDNSFAPFTISVPLRDDSDRPLWLWHPVLKRQLDVIAIPLLQNEGDDWAYRPINLMDNIPLSIQVGMDVYVLGYPFDFSSNPPSLPVWKRGSLASEPQLVGLGDKYYLVDTASREGMSGAPVILRSYGVHLTESGNSITDIPATRFLGVYSGRLFTKDSEDARLARVWPEMYINEIIDGMTRDAGSDY